MEFRFEDSDTVALALAFGAVEDKDKDKCVAEILMGPAVWDGKPEDGK